MGWEQVAFAQGTSGAAAGGQSGSGMLVLLPMYLLIFLAYLNTDFYK